MTCCIKSEVTLSACIANGKQAQTVCADSFAPVGATTTHGTYIWKKEEKVCVHVCGLGVGAKKRYAT